MARSRKEVISEMVDSGLFSDDEIRNAVKSKGAQAEGSGLRGYAADVVRKGFGGATTEALKRSLKDGSLRGVAESVIDSPALPIAGGVAGGVAGLPLGAGAIPIAGFGAAAGESYRQLGARALGMEAPKTSLEAAKKIGTEAVTQAAGEAFGMGVVNPLAKGAGRLLKKPAGDLFQIITKIKPEDAATLFKNPKTILPGAFKKAKEVWRKAAQEAGIPIDDVSPEIIDALKTDAKSTVFDTFKKLRAGEAVTAAEAQTAKKALDIALMPAAKTERNAPLVTLYGEIRKVFTKKIGEASPELAAANKGYGVARAGKRFQTLFPRNLNDTPAYFRSSVLPNLILGAGAMRGEPGEGALQALGFGAASSPLAIGSLIALAGGGRGLVPYARRTLTATLADIAKQRFDGK